MDVTDDLVSPDNSEFRLGKMRLMARAAENDNCLPHEFLNTPPVTPWG